MGKRVPVTHVGSQSDVTLVYIVKEGHLFPITDERLITIARRVQKPVEVDEDT